MEDLISFKLLAVVYFFIYVWGCEEVASSGQKVKAGYWKPFFLSFLLTPILGALYVLINKKSES